MTTEREKYPEGPTGAGGTLPHWEARCTQQAAELSTSQASEAAHAVETAKLNGLVALQADALRAVKDDVVNDDEAFLEMHTISTIDEAISASAETVQAFRDKLTSEAEARGAVKALEPIIRLCQDQDSLAEPNEGMSDYSDGYDAACKDVLELARATSKKG